jgi:O-antigen ligase
MTKLLWIALNIGIAILTVLAFTFFAPFHHTFLDIALIFSPLLIVFVALPATRTVIREGQNQIKNFTWWQVLWFLFFLSALVFRVRDEQDIHSSALDGWALYRIGLDFIVGALLMSRCLTGKTPRLRLLFCGLIGVMALYPLLALASTTWSAAPSFTLFRAVEYMLDLALIGAFVAAFNSVEDYQAFANWTWTLLGLLVLSAWIGALLDPADAWMEGYSYGPLRIRLEGVYPILDANSIGEYSAILASISLARILDDPEHKYDRAWYRLLFIATIITLIFTQTRAAVAAFVVALILLFVFTRRILLGTVLGITAAVGASVVLFFTNFGNTVVSYLLRGQTMAEAEGMSGRADMWQFAIRKISERPWTGYGGYAGGRFVVLPGLGMPGKSDVLNTMVESFIDLGVLGVIVLLIVFVGIWWHLFRASRSPNLNSNERHFAVELLLAMSIVTTRSFVAGNITSHAALAFLTILASAEFFRQRLKSAAQTTRKFRTTGLAFEAKTE